MSLQAIESAIEKIAFVPTTFGSALKNRFTQSRVLKDVGAKAAIGAGIGAVGNVAVGDSNQSVAERGLKGAVGGGLVGGLYGAGRQAMGAHQRNSIENAKGFLKEKGRFINNPEVHGVTGNRTPEQLARYKADFKAHGDANRKAYNNTQQ